MSFPKPGKRPRPAVKVFRDGREVCNMLTKAGKDEYHARIHTMWERQGRKCGLMITPQCKVRQGRLPIDQATFEHSQGRGMGGGKRTDAILDSDGKWMNMAACPFCNIAKASKPLSAVMADLIP